MNLKALRLRDRSIFKNNSKQCRACFLLDFTMRKKHQSQSKAQDYQISTNPILKHSLIFKLEKKGLKISNLEEWYSNSLPNKLQRLLRISEAFVLETKVYLTKTISSTELFLNS
jgi:hypothetical protein